MPSSSVLPRKQMRTPSRPSLGVRVRSPARYPAGRRYHFIIATRSCAPWHRVTNLPVNQELEREEYENTLRARARKWLSRRGGRHRCWPSIDSRALRSGMPRITLERGWPPILGRRKLLGTLEGRCGGNAASKRNLLDDFQMLRGINCRSAGFRQTPPNGTKAAGLPAMSPVAATAPNHRHSRP